MLNGNQTQTQAKTQRRISHASTPKQEKERKKGITKQETLSKNTFAQVSTKDLQLIQVTTNTDQQNNTRIRIT